MLKTSTIGLVGAIGAILVMLAPAPAPATAARSSAHVVMRSLELEVIQEINAVRVEHGLAPLALCAALTRAASAHSDQLLADGYFGHERPGGVSFAERIAYYYPVRPYSYYTAGENLLWDAATISAAHAVASWMASPPHRANSLNPQWRQIGVAVLHASSAPGVYHGSPVTLFTVDFGMRLS